jgi:hypothetical protein
MVLGTVIRSILSLWKGNRAIQSFLLSPAAGTSRDNSIVATAIDTARAFIFRDEFLTSPVSPLYVFAREEDIALQKARSTINERVHARLWVTPYTFEGGEYGSNKSAEILAFA